MAVTGCKKKDPDAVPLGTTGLSIDVSGREDKSLFVEEKSPGVWNVSAEGDGLTTIDAKYERGMPTKESLERDYHRIDVEMGNKGNVADGDGGALTYHATRTHCSGCSEDKPQYFSYVYVPTADGAARCSGWSENAGDEHVTICRRFKSSTKPGAAAASADKPAGAAPPSAAAPPPAPPKP